MLEIQLKWNCILQFCTTAFWFTVSACVCFGLGVGGLPQSMNQQEEAGVQKKKKTFLIYFVIFVMLHGIMNMYILYIFIMYTYWSCIHVYYKNNWKIRDVGKSLHMRYQRTAFTPRVSYKKGSMIVFGRFTSFLMIYRLNSTG